MTLTWGLLKEQTYRAGRNQKMASYFYEPGNPLPRNLRGRIGSDVGRTCVFQIVKRGVILLKQVHVWEIVTLMSMQSNQSTWQGRLSGGRVVSKFSSRHSFALLSLEKTTVILIWWTQLSLYGIFFVLQILFISFVLFWSIEVLVEHPGVVWKHRSWG